MASVFEKAYQAVTGLNIGSKHKRNDPKILRKLLNACKTGDIDTVNECLLNNININYECEYTGFTPLKYACYFGHISIINILLKQNDIDVNYSGGKWISATSNFHDFGSPIYLATIQAQNNPKKYFQIIKILYKSTSNININCATARYLHTPLLMSVKLELCDIFKYYLSKSEIQIHKLSNFKWNCLHFASFYNYKTVEIMKILLEYGINPNAQATDGSTSLHLCIRSFPLNNVNNNNIYKQKIKLLLKYGSDIYKKDKLDKNVLDYCNDIDKTFLLNYGNKQKQNDNNNGINVIYPSPQAPSTQMNDNIALNINRKEFKNWFSLSPLLYSKYYDKFVELEYDNICLIALIDKNVLKNTILMNDLHFKSLIKKINIFNKKSKKFEKYICDDCDMEEYWDLLESVAIITFNIFYKRIKTFNDIIKIIGNDNVNDAKYIFKNTPKMKRIQKQLKQQNNNNDNNDNDDNQQNEGVQQTFNQ